MRIVFLISTLLFSLSSYANLTDAKAPAGKDCSAQMAMDSSMYIATCMQGCALNGGAFEFCAKKCEGTRNEMGIYARGFGNDQTIPGCRDKKTKMLVDCLSMVIKEKYAAATGNNAKAAQGQPTSPAATTAN